MTVTLAEQPRATPIPAQEVAPRPAVALASLGCRTNQEEVAHLRWALGAEGFRVVNRADEADILILNTCSVTSRAESEARRLVRSFAASMPHVKIAVTGCLAQQKPVALARIPGVRWVVGNALKSDLPRILGHDAGGVFVRQPDGLVVPAPAAIAPPDRAVRTRYAIKIQEGCDFRCAYCIVPQLRGASRSAAAAQVIDAARRALDAGYRELVLTGTHIGQYADGGTGLAGLLDLLMREQGDFRVRLSSLDPRDLSGDLVALLATHPRICDHVHLSVQSLCGGVLSRMDRAQTGVEAVARGVGALRTARPLCAVGGDFIVGFPGESAHNFAETLRHAAEIGFTHGHVFRYSARPGTPAAAMPDRVDARESRERSRALRDLLDRQRATFIQGLRGRSLQVLVEREDPATGLTSNYLRVSVPSHSAPHNSWLPVRITGLGSDHRLCIGEVYGQS